MQEPTKAILIAAGLSSRFLPATKELAKQVFPIVDKPIIQHCVEEVVGAGVKDVILVTSREGDEVQTHFDQNKGLEDQLREQGKADKADMIHKVARMANYINIRQQPYMQYGTATGLVISKELVADGPFFYLYADDIVAADEPVCKQLLNVYKKNPDAAAVIAVQKMPEEVLYRYGVCKIKDGTDNVLESTVEKPKTPSEAPSNLVSFGRFLFTPKILPILETLKTGLNNELWIIDAVKELAQKEKVLVHEIEGQWFTTGDSLNYIKANIEFALRREEFRDDLLTFLNDKVNTNNK